MKQEYWLVCKECGYSRKVSFGELSTVEKCSMCGTVMVIDIRRIEEPIGDNFPHIANSIIKTSNKYKGKNITEDDINRFHYDLELINNVSDLIKEWSAGSN